MCCGNINRRDFMGLAAASIAGTSLGIPSSLFAQAKIEEWNPDKLPVITGKKLRVQPVLLYRISKRRFQASWRPWSGLHNEEDVSKEINRISEELKLLLNNSDFPLEILPIFKVRSVE